MNELVHGMPKSDFTRALWSARLKRPDSLGEYVMGRRWTAYPWIRHVSKRITDAVSKGGARLIINVPPRHGKTMFIGKVVPAWFLTHWPDKEVISSGHSDSLVRETGKDVRNILRDHPALNVRLQDDSKRANRWQTEAGGGLSTISVGGAAMGKGGSLILIDDLYARWADAQSMRTREEVIDWFLTTLYNRQAPNASIIVQMTRFHRDDLCGYLLNKHADSWEHIRLPAIAEADDELGRKPGEPLCEAMYNLDALNMLRKGGSEDGWNAMYQQNPPEQRKGAVYRSFSGANLDANLDFWPGLPLCMAWDFNTNPGCHVEIGQYNSVSDEFRIIHEIHGPRMDVREACDAFIKLMDNLGGMRWPRIEIFGDATGNTAAAGYGHTHYQTIEAKLKDKGWKFIRRVPPAQPRIHDRVNVMNEVLCTSIDSVRRMFIHPRCEKLIRDFREQMADPEGLPDKADQKLSHASEAVGYMVCQLRPFIVKPTLRVGRFG